MSASRLLSVWSSLDGGHDSKDAVSELGNLTTKMQPTGFAAPRTARLPPRKRIFHVLHVAALSLAPRAHPCAQRTQHGHGACRCRRQAQGAATPSATGTTPSVVTTADADANTCVATYLPPSLPAPPHDYASSTTGIRWLPELCVGVAGHTQYPGRRRRLSRPPHQSRTTIPILVSRRRRACGTRLRTCRWAWGRRSWRRWRRWGRGSCVCECPSGREKTKKHARPRRSLLRFNWTVLDETESKRHSDDDRIRVLNGMRRGDGWGRRRRCFPSVGRMFRSPMVLSKGALACRRACRRVREPPLGGIPVVGDNTAADGEGNASVLGVILQPAMSKEMGGVEDEMLVGFSDETKAMNGKSRPAMLERDYVDEDCEEAVNV